MNILIDTNVILDVLLCRVPYNVESVDNLKMFVMTMGKVTC